MSLHVRNMRSDYDYLKWLRFMHEITVSYTHVAYVIAKGILQTSIITREFGASPKLMWLCREKEFGGAWGD